MHLAAIIESGHGFLADAVDVHHLAADEVLDAAHDLRWAVVLIGTRPRCFTLHTHQLSAASGTVRHEGDLLGLRVAPRQFHTGDFGDDFATLFHVHPVALVDVEAVEDVGIVQRCALDDGAGEQYRLEVGHRSDDTKAAHVERHEAQLCQRSFGRKLICHSPARGLGGEAQLLLTCERVDLEHQAVGGHRQRAALGVPTGDECVHFGHRMQTGHGRGHLEAPRASGFHVGKVAVVGQVLAQQVV